MTSAARESLRIAVLVKQVPHPDQMNLGADGRLQRQGLDLDLEMNAFCRRAVTAGVETAALSGGSCTVLTVGPPTAAEVLREALACGADAGLLISDPLLAGSDTLATARAIHAALRLTGPYDLILTGRNSIDADTAHVGPQVAELLGLPFLAAVRSFELARRTIVAELESDDGWIRAQVTLPALLSCAERLCRPCKASPERRAGTEDRIRTLSAAELGPGPWGVAASRTSVGELRSMPLNRARHRLSGPVGAQVDEAVALLAARGGLAAAASAGAGEPAGSGAHLEGPPSRSGSGGPGQVPPRAERGPGGPGGLFSAPPVLGVVVEPGREHVARELIGLGASLAAGLGGHVVAVATDPAPPTQALGGWGADALLLLEGSTREDDVAAGLATWSELARPWALLCPATAWGRQVAARAAVRLDAGLTGDAVSVEEVGGRLVCWKAVAGGRLLAAVTARSAVQMVTVRPGVAPLLTPRRDSPLPVTCFGLAIRSRVLTLARHRDDDSDALAHSQVVVGVGTGVGPGDYPALRPLLDLLGAELAATRRVTDRGWLPRSRQVGITGCSLAPRLYVAVGLAGNNNHMIGTRQAGTVLAINSDPTAPVFDSADIGICAEWQDALPQLVGALQRHFLYDPAPATDAANA